MLPYGRQSISEEDIEAVDAVAMKVIGVVTTSSPAPTPRAE